MRGVLRVGTAWAIIGAVIGAGLASGREVAAFFSRWGPWSWLGVASATVTIGLMGHRAMRPAAPAWWRTALLTALLTATGGAMLAGSGEIAALTLPLRGAYWLGLAGTLGLAAFFSERNLAGLAALSRALVGSLLALLIPALLLPPTRGAWLTPPSAARPLIRGLCYGGFNVALATPVLAEAADLPPGEKRRLALSSSAALGLILALGNAVLLRHPGLAGQPLPYVALAARLGRWGQGVAALALYLATLTTLTACLRGLRGLLRARWAVALPALVALMGFTGAVDALYPALGALCCAGEIFGRPRPRDCRS